MSSDHYDRVALSRIAGVGPKLFRALLSHFGTANAALRARGKELRRIPGLAERTSAEFGKERHLREAEAILLFAEQHGVDILSVGTKRYPPALARVAAMPPVLYRLGTTDFTNVHTLSVVGTRNMTTAGGRQVERLLDPLVPYRPLVVSGLAYGVDVAAHRFALRTKLPTVAVLASGLQHIYPHTHRRVARQLTESGGGLLTEYPHWVTPQREYFPARNRLVALLGAMTVVVESNLRGGSMITAGMASGFGRPVGACPGRGGEAATAGCNELIKTGKAHLIADGNDVVELLGWKGAGKRGRQIDLFPTLEGNERAVVELLSSERGTDIDELRRRLLLPPAKLSGTLLMLEVKGVVAALPGNRYRLAI